MGGFGRFLVADSGFLCADGMAWSSLQSLGAFENLHGGSEKEGRHCRHPAVEDDLSDQLMAL